MSASGPSSPSQSPAQQSSPERSARTESDVSAFIHHRYQDISLFIFRQEQKRRQQPTNYLSYGESVKHRAYSSYGNASVIVKKSGHDVTKTDERPIQSKFCVLM